jgi:hypothetical protein
MLPGKLIFPDKAGLPPSFGVIAYISQQQSAPGIPRSLKRGFILEEKGAMSYDLNTNGR